MRRGRWIRGVVALSGALVACDTSRAVLGALAELQAVQSEVVKAIGEDNVRVNLHNNSYLSVGVINSPLRKLPDELRRAKAKEIAKVAFQSLPSRASLKSVSVAFVIHKSYFLFFNYNDATDSFAFTPEELTQPQDLGRSAKGREAAEQGVEADEAGASRWSFAA